MSHDWIVPDWPAPARVRAVSTTRAGGVSEGAYATFNLGHHVGDRPEAVAENRKRLMTALGLVREPRWLNQEHGVNVVRLVGQPVTHAADDTWKSPTGDGCWTDVPGEVCVILTADCLPVLFSDRKGSVVGAAHAGWRGLAAGVLENTVAAMGVPAGELLAWLGPAIGPESYEVGEEVRQAFVERDAQAARAFKSRGQGKWLCDLYTLARMKLNSIGVQEVHGGGLCTLKDGARFYSYRREGQCGRMGTMVWIEG